MCYAWVPYVFAAVAAAGSAVNSTEQRRYMQKVDQQQKKAVLYAQEQKRLEEERQKALSQETAGVSDANVQQNTRSAYDTDLAGAEAAFQSAYDAQAPLLTDGKFLSGQDRAGGEIKDEIAARTTEASRNARDRAKALATLTGYGIVDNGNAIGIQQGNDLLNTINGIRRGSLAVNRQETSVPAAQVNAKSSGWGEALSLIGSLGLSATGGMGGGGGGGGGRGAMSASQVKSLYGETPSMLSGGLI